MSTAHATPTAGDHAHDHDAHDFDGEPVQALPADEPRTPGWVPILGVVLFAVAGVAFLVIGDKSGEAGAQTAPPSTGAPAPSPSPVNTAPPVPTEMAQPRPAALPIRPSAEPSAQRLTPEQVKGIKGVIDKERTKRGLPPLPAPSAPRPLPTK
jgi:hypothetical protein